jgi:D-alanine-D-alanine ligase
MKWIEYEKMSVAVVAEPKIQKTLREQTMRVFKELGGNGYARCDYRMDASGDIYMLEINPNCGIFYPPHEPGSADFSLLNDPVDHTKFMKLIIRNAQMRQTRIAAEKIIKRQSRKRPIAVEQMAYS